MAKRAQKKANREARSKNMRGRHNPRHLKCTTTHDMRETVMPDHSTSIVKKERNVKVGGFAFEQQIQMKHIHFM